MKEINIAKTLIAKRKEKAITQEELAAYIGVTKASVSKWETGQSYPDISLLPVLATYFNISIDELIDYSPQLTKEDIKKLYFRLTREFSGNPFEEVIKECHVIIKKYYSCFPLLLKMALLLTNHYMLAKEKELQEKTLDEVVDLCRRIKEECEDVGTLKEANSLEAICSLILQRPENVLTLLAGTKKPTTSDDVVLASAYQMTGNMKKANEVLQSGIYYHLMELMDILPSCLVYNQDVPERFEMILHRALSLGDLFEIDQLNPGIMLKLYLVAAHGYAMQNNQDRALDMIKKYAQLCLSHQSLFTLHGDDFFDSIEEWFSEFDLGAKAPRDEKVIKTSMLQAIMENPAFASLKERPAFISIMETMKSTLGGI